MSVSTADVEDWVGRPLPRGYSKLLPTFRDAIIGRQVLLYPLDRVIERNETFETKVYCPGHLAIGDDSGGNAVVIALDDPDCNLFMVAQGSMDPDDFEPLHATLGDWLGAQCPLPATE